MSVLEKHHADTEYLQLSPVKLRPLWNGENRRQILALSDVLFGFGYFNTWHHKYFLEKTGYKILKTVLDANTLTIQWQSNEPCGFSISNCLYRSQLWSTSSCVAHTSLQQINQAIKSKNDQVEVLKMAIGLLNRQNELPKWNVYKLLFELS